LVDNFEHTAPSSPEVVVFVGLPGAGKTTYYDRVLKPLGYERVNELSVGGLEERMKVVEELLVAGKSVGFRYRLQ
jgi:bifunctional polynucleotide phosphatase/kinase